MLSTAAVIGREFDVGLLAETTDLDREQVLDSLELAEAARLVEATPTHGGYTFVHALVRTTLYDEIPTTRRLRTHRRVAAALEPRAERGDDALLPSLARHYCEAAALGRGRQGDPVRDRRGRARARPARLRGGGRPLRARPRRPRAWVGRGARPAVPAAHRTRGARLSAGNRTEGHRAAYAAADEARATNQPDLLGDALLAIGGVRGWSEAGLRRRGAHRARGGGPGVDPDRGLPPPVLRDCPAGGRAVLRPVRARSATRAHRGGARDGAPPRRRRDDGVRPELRGTGGCGCRATFVTGSRSPTRSSASGAPRRTASSSSAGSRGGSSTSSSSGDGTGRRGPGCGAGDRGGAPSARVLLVRRGAHGGPAA